MTLQEAISILRIHQVWRKGADVVMIEPKELTEAIEVILNYHYDYFDATSSPINKEEQKKLITEIMNEDAKDGLYETKIPNVGKDTADYIDRHIIESMKELAKEGHLKKLEIPEISDEQIMNAAEYEYEHLSLATIKNAFVHGATWYREQLKLKQ